MRSGDYNKRSDFSLCSPSSTQPTSSSNKSAALLSSTSYPGPPQSITMSFHESAIEITVEGNILKAQLSNGEEYFDAEFDLDTVIGVSDGALTWGGESTTTPLLIDAH